MNIVSGYLRTNKFTNADCASVIYKFYFFPLSFSSVRNWRDFSASSTWVSEPLKTNHIHVIRFQPLTNLATQVSLRVINIKDEWSWSVGWHTNGVWIPLQKNTIYTLTLDLNDRKFYLRDDSQKTINYHDWFLGYDQYRFLILKNQHNTTDLVDFIKIVSYHVSTTKNIDYSKYD